MIFPSRKPIGKQADHTDGASGGCRQGRPGRNPASQDVSPIKWDNVILYGQYVLDRAQPDASQGGESRLAYDYFRFVR